MLFLILYIFCDLFLLCETWLKGIRSHVHIIIAITTMSRRWRDNSSWRWDRRLHILRCLLLVSKILMWNDFYIRPWLIHASDHLSSLSGQQPDAKYWFEFNMVTYQHAAGQPRLYCLSLVLTAEMAKVGLVYCNLNYRIASHGHLRAEYRSNEGAIPYWNDLTINNLILVEATMEGFSEHLKYYWAKSTKAKQMGFQTAQNL